MEDTKTKFIDFIGVERFDLIIDSHLVNIVNCMKIKGQEVQVAQLMTFKFGKKTKKMNIVNCMKIKEEVQIAQLRTFKFGKWRDLM